MPVLLLSARDQVEDRVRGSSWAPTTTWSSPSRSPSCSRAFAPSCGAAAPALEATSLKVADLELDLLRRRVTRARTAHRPDAKEFGLLELLMRRQGEVLPRSLIASQVWDMNFDSDTNVIEVAMRRLRAKVDGFSTRLIQTVRGMGYVLEAPEP